MNTEKDFFNELLEHLLAQQSKKALKRALRQLLTRAELGEIPKRLQILKMLEAGFPQRDIAKALGVGIATVTRGSRAMSENRR